MQKSKIEEALGKYNLELTDEQVASETKALLDAHPQENMNQDVYKFLMGSIELTTLKTTDSDRSVMDFTEKVNKFDSEYPNLPHVATICVYPCFAAAVKNVLQVDGVEIACVSGSFPSSQACIEVKTIETALAIKDGATEIDMVLSVGKFLDGDYETICEEISEMKVQDIITKKKTGLQTNRTASGAPLKGLLRCGYCDGAMVPSFCINGKKRYHYYRCVKSHKHVTEDCQLKMIPADMIEKEVFRIVSEVVEDEFFLQSIVVDCGVSIGEARKFMAELVQRLAHIAAIEHGICLGIVLDIIK